MAVPDPSEVDQTDAMHIESVTQEGDPTVALSEPRSDLPIEFGEIQTQTGQEALQSSEDVGVGLSITTSIEIKTTM